MWGFEGNLSVRKGFLNIPLIAFLIRCAVAYYLNVIIIRKLRPKSFIAQ